jgi:hypothetical protein
MILIQMFSLVKKNISNVFFSKNNISNVFSSPLCVTMAINLYDTFKVQILLRIAFLSIFYVQIQSTIYCLFICFELL